MKKNKFMRVAAVLLILCLATTCAISSTFAKYTTSDSAGDSARVAKWGVTVEVTGENAFANEYTADKASTDANKANAEVSATTAVVAPGTEGVLGTVAIAGTPEVAVAVTVDVDVELANWTVDGAVYFPVVVKLGDTAITVSATNLEGIEAEIEVAIIEALTATGVTTSTKGTGKTVTVNYAPNTALTKNVTVNWEWPFSTTDNDAKDTALGNAATATATEPTIACTIAVTVEQIDTYTAPTPPAES